MKMKTQEETLECECLAEPMTAGQSVSTVSALDPNSMICKVTTAYVLGADSGCLIGYYMALRETENRHDSFMKPLTRTVILLAMVSCCAGRHYVSYSQTKAPPKKATATVSGRVTVGGKGRAGIFVGLGRNNFASTQTPPRNAITDADGNYRISGVPPGSYYVAPMSALFVVEDSNPVTQIGKQLLLSEGEIVEDIDFAMMRGSVITGKVTESDGRPVVEQRVSAISVDQTNRSYVAQSLFQTDDRGIYRIFGLRAGRYKVAAGQTDDRYLGSAGRPGYQPVFYPNATSADQAKIVELAEGEQATNIDITMSRALPGFTVSGTIVNGETNKTATNIRVVLQKMNDDRGSFTQAGTISNQKGEFRLENIPPGKYSIVLMAQDSELRADPLEFQLLDQDLTGLVVRTSHGASVSGTVQVEGTNDPGTMAKLRQLRIYAWVQGGMGGGARPSLIAADGGFRIAPLPAGIVNFEFVGMDYSETGFILLRVERDGVVVPRGGFDIKAGEQVSGVRIVLTRGNGTVRGTVTFQNGPPTPGMRFLVRLSKPGDNELRLSPKEVDARGRFMIEGVLPGVYDLSVNSIDPGSRQRAPSATQSITVADNTITDVVVSIDLARNP